MTMLPRHAQRAGHSHMVPNWQQPPGTRCWINYHHLWLFKEPSFVLGWIKWKNVCPRHQKATDILYACWYKKNHTKCQPHTAVRYTARPMIDVNLNSKLLTGLFIKDSSSHKDISLCWLGFRCYEESPNPTVDAAPLILSIWWARQGMDAAHRD